MNLRRVLLRPLSPVYVAGQALERKVSHRLHGRPQALPSPVISVGSVSAGGAGKTPMVLLLAEMLRRREYAVRILTRGYGRRGKGTERVDPQGDAEHFGDEPMLLARRAGVPVVVGADRYRAGHLAEELGTKDAKQLTVHLLDDGFQHQRLLRDIDVVLLTRRDLEDMPLPAGNLREPLRALRRADVIVLREDEAAGLLPAVEELLRELPDARDATDATKDRRQKAPALWRVRRSQQITPELKPGSPRRVLVFCGIARPEEFLAMLGKIGVQPVGTVLFRDHHRYHGRDLERIAHTAKELKATALLTTEKDAVKLTEAMRLRLENAAPLHIAELHGELVDERAAMDDLISLEGRLDRRRRRAARL